MKRLVLTFLFLSAARGTPAGAAGTSVAVIVHPSNPVTALKRDEIVNLYLRRSTRFPNGKEAAPRDQAPGPSKEAFYQWLFSCTLDEIRDYWVREVFQGGRRPPEYSDSKDDVAMKGWVSSNHGGIGYISRSALDGSVKEVQIKE